MEQKQPLVAEIISIGTELLLGELVDTNAAFLARQLRDLGYHVFAKSVVGDNRRRLGDAISRALTRSGLVVLTGGLGPTEDDVTRDAIADVVQEEMTEDPVLLAHLEEMFLERGRPMTPNNRRQALLIPAATPLDNPRGTAWGWWVPHHGGIIVALPGPPGEMELMWLREVKPRLPVSSQHLFCRTFHTWGRGESQIAATLGPLLEAKNPSVATYARDHGVDVRLAASAPQAASAQALADPVEERIRTLLGPAIYGIDEETLPVLVGRALGRRSENLAVMEGGSGGVLTRMLGEVPGTSAWLRGCAMIGQDPGRLKCWFDRRNFRDTTRNTAQGTADRAEGEGEAVEMARAIRAFWGTDWGLATAGLADPNLFPEDQQIPLAFAIVGKGVSWSGRTNWPGSLAKVRYRAVYGLLWHLLSFLDIRTP